MMPIACKETALGVELQVRVAPNAGKTAVTGLWQSALKVSIAAQPKEGRANKVLCEYVARRFKLPKKAVSIVRGGKSRSKTLLLQGIKASSIQAILADIVSEANQKSRKEKRHKP